MVPNIEPLGCHDQPQYSLYTIESDDEEAETLPENEGVAAMYEKEAEILPRHRCPTFPIGARHEFEVIMRQRSAALLDQSGDKLGLDHGKNLEEEEDTNPIPESEIQSVPQQMAAQYVCSKSDEGRVVAVSEYHF